MAFDVFAVVTGTDANLANDRISSVIGSFKSTPVSGDGLLFGNLVMDVRRTVFDPDTGDPIDAFGFDQIGYSVGMIQDLDGDGDLDVGSNNASIAAHHWAARSVTAPNGPSAPAPSGRMVGFGTFTVTSSAGSTLVNFFGRDSQFGGVYVQDGAHVIGPSIDSPPENGILIRAVPEPASIAVIAPLALALRRRRGRR
jgi:hypothetical protein